MKNLLSLLIFFGCYTQVFAYADMKKDQTEAPVANPTIPDLVISKADADKLGAMTIQDGGRLKPLDTYARTRLLTFYGKSALKSDDLKKSAMQWIAGVLINPYQAYRENIFTEKNPAAIEALGLEPRKSSHYNFEELSKALTANRSNLELIASKDAKERTLVERQLLELQMKVSNFYEISLSFSAFHKNIVINDKDLASALGIEAGGSYSYLLFVKHRAKLTELLTALRSKNQNQYVLMDLALVNLVRELNGKMSDQSAQPIDLISPVKGTEKYLAPWEALDGRELDDATEKSLFLLKDMIDALRQKDSASFDKNFADYQSLQVPFEYLDLELSYNKFDFFTNSLVFYILSLLLLAGAFIFETMKSKKLNKLSYGLALTSLIVGLGLHGGGIVSRMVIMSRPPVSTLYESVLFAGFIAVLMGLLLELWNRKGMGMLVSGIVGTILIFLSFKYLKDGDTMGMLVAVLDSNFWLGTHVVTIIIGYGATLFAGLLGHIYLMQCCFRKNKKDLQELYKVMIGASLIALLFTTLGTILGGIWADQSWGRFWGWDPKENGALLIVLFLLVAIHGRIAGKYRGIGYAVALVITNISVAVAWFGVNLLQVGLHSYGFDDKTYNALVAFCSFELFFAIVVGIIAKIRQN